MSQITAFYRNESSINLKIFPTHGGIKRFERKFNKQEIKPKGVYRNINGCILESNILEVIKTVYHFIDSNL